MYTFFHLVMASAYGCLIYNFVAWLFGWRLVNKSHKSKVNKTDDKK